MNDKTSKLIPFVGLLALYNTMEAIKMSVETVTVE